MMLHTTSRNAKRFRAVIGLSLTLSMFGGCATFNQESKEKEPSAWSPKRFWKKEYQKPQSLAAIWAPDTLAVPGQVSTRGFGGRIYFYNEKSQAVPIDGELIVHGYVESKKKSGSMEDVQADKVFRFTAEQMSGHFSPSELGASYSVWIPWDAADGVRQELTLIPTFKAADGTIVQGAAAKVNLPGRSPDGEHERTPIQSVSYQHRSIPSYGSAATEDSTESKAFKRMTTTTIRIPPASSIGQPRQSFVLNAPPLSGTAHPTGDVKNANQISEGVSVGGSNINNSTPVIPPYPSMQPREPFPQNLGLPQLPPVGLLPASIPEKKPIASNGLEEKLPIKPTPWNDRSEQVQRASFQSQLK